MTDSPYAISLEDLLDTARVPLAEQVVERPERRLLSDCSAGPVPFGDLVAGDAGCD